MITDNPLRREHDELKEFKRERSQVIIERKDVEILAKSKAKGKFKYVILYLISLIAFGVCMLRLMTYGITTIDSIIVLIGILIMFFSVKKFANIKDRFIKEYMNYFDEKGELRPDILDK